jgi:hypothetical protein
MKRIPAFIALMIVLAACNNNNKMSGWSKEGENKFMNDCLNSSGNNPQAKQICSCVLGKLEKKYATSMDADARGTQQEGRELAQECLNEGNNNNLNNRNNTDDNNNNLNRNNTDNNKMAGWSKEGENKFMDACLKSSGNNPQAKQVCSCVLEKLEKKYATSMDADAGGSEQEGRELAQECMNDGNMNNNNNNLNNGNNAGNNNTDNTSGNEQSTDPSKFTGSWVGQGMDYIEIRFNNGQYFITLDADNTSKPNKTVIKAKEENGKLIVDPGISYGFNGTSTMTLVGKKLILKAGNSTYTYERRQL